MRSEAVRRRSWILIPSRPNRGRERLQATSTPDVVNVPTLRGGKEKLDHASGRECHLDEFYCERREGNKVSSQFATTTLAKTRNDPMGLFISQMQVRQSDRRNGPYSLRWALAEDIIDADPCGGIKKPVPLKASRNVVLNEDQLKAFWLGLDAAPMGPDTRTALKLSCVTAQRIGTVASIRLSDLHLGDEQPHWIIPRLRKGRSRKLRRHLVPLSPLAV